MGPQISCADMMDVLSGNLNQTEVLQMPLTKDGGYWAVKFWHGSMPTMFERQRLLAKPWPIFRNTLMWMWSTVIVALSMNTENE